MNYSLWFWILNGCTALIRLLIAGRIGLSGDEAHYWTYGRYPDLSYFDHPPAIGYLIKFSTLIFGNNEFAVRFPAILCFFITSYLVYRVARSLFGERVAFFAAVLLNIVPVFSFLGAVITIPDAPLACLWMAFIAVTLRLIETSKRSWWYVLGVLLGLGLLCKYNAILLVPSLFLFLYFLSPHHRHWFLKYDPYLALTVSLAVFFPVILWNMENGWVSFGFQLRHGFGHAAPKFSPTLLGQCLGAQAGYVSPLLFFLYWITLFILGWRAFRDRDRKALFVFSFSFPTLFLFTSIASFNEILPHWPAMGYLALTIGVAQLMVASWAKKWFRVFCYCAGGLAVLLNILVPLQAMYKVLPPEIFLPRSEAQRLEDGITRAEKIDLTNELYGWEDAGKAVADIIERSPEPKPFVFTHRHYIASQLSFYIPGHPRVYCLSDRLDAYDLWQRDLSSLKGRDGIFVTNDYFYLDPESVFPFSQWEPARTVEIFRKGRKVRIFWISEGRGFDPERLPREYTSAMLGPRLGMREALINADHQLFWLINHRMHTPSVDYLMSNLTRLDNRLGINTGLIFLVILIGAILRQFRREHFWQEFLLAVGIIAVGGILVHFLKDAFERLRPLAVFGDQVITFYERLERGSFPSGHTQIAFSVATYLSAKIPQFWPLFYALALFMGFSRVYVGSHFPGDVLGGAVVGILVALIMMRLIKIGEK